MESTTQSPQPDVADAKASTPAKAFLSWANLRRLFRYLAPHKGRMGVALLALMLASGFGLMFPMLIVKLLDGVTRTGDYRLLNMLVGGLIGLFFLQAVFSFIESYLLAFIGEKVVYNLRTSLYRHLQGLSFDFFATRRVGDLVSRLSSDVTQMRTVLTTNVGMLLSHGLLAIGSLVIMLRMNLRLTLFILGLAPALILVAMFFSGKIQKGSTRVQDELAHSTTVAEEGLQGIRVVKSFGREDHQSMRYVAAMDKTFHAAFRMAFYSTLLTSIMTFLGFCFIGVIIWFGGREVIAGRLTSAMITGFLIYGITIASSLSNLSSLFGQVNAALGGIQRVFELMDLEPTVQDAPGAATLSDCKGGITFQDVSFGYDAEKPVLCGIDLDIRPGEILALVGPSGAGKSTLFNLVPRFYDPTGGRLLIDGQDMREITQESLRAQMAVVPQETTLFGGTIRENLLFGRLDATEEEMIAAARAANAHEFILSMPQAYDSPVAERGGNLSGGQRQRIAIARAILRNPRIFLLDEATSSLDNESEELVQDALNHLMQSHRTTLIIAHRLSTIKYAHRIAVMDGGRIAELGTHQELMNLNGLYARLYSMQFRDPDEKASPIHQDEVELIGALG